MNLVDPYPRLCDVPEDERFAAGFEADSEHPQCYGAIVSGSGGHRMHAFAGCQRRGVYWHPDDSYAYCAEHVTAADVSRYDALWAQTIGKWSRR